MLVLKQCSAASLSSLSELDLNPVFTLIETPSTFLNVQHVYERKTKEYCSQLDYGWKTVDFKHGKEKDI